jgi:L-aminopeptidase/D-esterase-like protein
MSGSLTDIAGLSVGHWTNKEAGTGCTVVLCPPEGAVCGVDVRGGSPGTRETDLLKPECSVEKAHAILLAGGSAFGLAAADGVMRWLEEHDRGFDVGIAKVPIVPSAILFDLPMITAKIRPDAAAGYAACENANPDAVKNGTIGAGTGATVGKILGLKQATKGGIGSSSIRISNGIIVAALVALNAFGGVIDPSTGQIVAGPRKLFGSGFVDSVESAQGFIGQAINRAREVWSERANTTLAVVATNVQLTKAGATKMAQMAHDGLARTIRPIHTMFDGDVVFGLSCGDKKADLSLIGALAADTLANAVLNAVYSAEGLGGVPAIKDL